MGLRRSFTRWGATLVLAGILLAAGWLRLAGHNWDQDQHLNADDAYIAKVTLTHVTWPPGTALTRLLDPAASPLNPRTDGGYVYGALPLYLVKATAAGATALTGDAYYTGYNGTLQTGRVLAGLFDTLTVLLVFALGLRLWGAGAGLVAAALYAGAVLPIQLAHFYICEPFMATFMAATLLSSLLFAQTGRRRWLAAAGWCAGLALACKLSAFPVGVLPLLAAIAWAARAENGRGLRAGRTRLALAGLLGLVGLTAFAGLLVGDPFAVLGGADYLARMSAQTATQTGANDLWFTRKYVGTAPLFYLGGQLLLLGVGPLVGVAGILGAGLVAIRAWRTRQAPDLLLLAGAGAYFASIAFWEIKWVRYLVPLAPYLCLFATALGGALVARVAPARRPLAAGLGLGGLVLSGALGGLAVSAIYHAPQTQIAASQWIYAHIPPGRRIGVEVTTIPLPLPLPGHPAPAQEYPQVRLDPLADLPSPAAAAALRSALAKADYLVVDTTQAASTVPRLPWRYPVPIRYYDLLFSGQLGFTPVYTATSYPTVLGLAIPDEGWADASFMDSSHPPIHIFQKTRPLTDAEWAGLFAGAVQQAAVASRHAP